jgi:DDE domain
MPAARHVSEQYANDSVEADHGRLNSRLRAMRALKQPASARTALSRARLVQNLHRGHYELTADLPRRDRVRVAFTELAAHRIYTGSQHPPPQSPTRPLIGERNSALKNAT